MTKCETCGPPLLNPPSEFHTYDCWRARAEALQVEKDELGNMFYALAQRVEALQVERDEARRDRDLFHAFLIRIEKYAREDQMATFGTTWLARVIAEFTSIDKGAE